MLAITAEQTPLRVDEQGVVRVGKSRVTLETIVGVYNQGASAEQIARDFPTLDLADIYAVLSYYLRHRAEVEAHLREQDWKADEIRRAYEARFGVQPTREHLLAKRDRQERAGS